MPDQTDSSSPNPDPNEADVETHAAFTVQRPRESGLVQMEGIGSTSSPLRVLDFLHMNINDVLDHPCRSS